MLKKSIATPENLIRPDLVTREEAAAFLGVSVQTLRLWACKGQNDLPYIKVGRAVRYRVSDLHKFLDRRTFTSTAEYAADGRALDAAGIK
jgi:excisionase family DNA binding protein